MLVADTSWLFALIDGDDLHHAKAIAQAGSGRSFLVPSEILAETLALVRWKFGREAQHALLAALTAMPHARIGATRAAVVDQAVHSALRPGPLSYEDWIVVHTCGATGARPWSFDKGLLRACR